MIKNKCSDLLRRAKQLADLEGSEFISWNESISAINESYIGLYQKLIDMGDQSFINSFDCSSGSFELPADFWQLKSVVLNNNGIFTVINRRTDNQSIHHLSYDIKNGVLSIYGRAANVHVEYFTTPKTLTFKPSDIVISLPDQEYLDCYKHTFLYKGLNEEEKTTFSIYDMDNIKTKENFIVLDGDYEEFEIIGGYITEDYVVLMCEDYSYLVYCISTGYCSLMAQDTAPIFTEDGNFFIEDAQTIYAIQPESLSSYSAIPITTIETYQNVIFYVANVELTDFYYLGTDFHIYHNGESKKEITADKLCYSNKECYFMSPFSFGKVTENNETEIINQQVGLPVGISGINQDTGYGFISKMYGSAYFVKPYVLDTELDFPNSFYYQMLCYMLAISFKAKQGADITLLSTQLATIEQTFEATLGNDAYQFPRMGNVYN